MAVSPMSSRWFHEGGCIARQVVRKYQQEVINLYNTETYEGKRVQKFAYQGLRSLEQLRSGPAWPEDSLFD